jgi:hypothetical protein
LELADAKKEQKETICRMQEIHETERRQLEERIADTERAKEVW